MSAKLGLFCLNHSTSAELSNAARAVDWPAPKMQAKYHGSHNHLNIAIRPRLLQASAAAWLRPV